MINVNPKPKGKSKDILFFIAGSVPTDADRAAAEKLGTQKFRNASVITELDRAEKCAGVASLGEIPPQYKDFKQVSASAPAAPVPPVPPAQDEPPAGEAEAQAEAEGMPAAPEASPQAAEAAAPEGPTQEEVDAFAAQSIDVIIGLVRKKKITAEKALELEQLGKNRPTCIKRLTEAAE